MIARKGRKINVTSNIVVVTLTMAFKATVFNVLLIHARVSVKLVLMTFSTSCNDGFLFRDIACIWCSLCEFITSFRIGHRAFYCTQGKNKS